jgi:hypothetical protein
LVAPLSPHRRKTPCIDWRTRKESAASGPESMRPPVLIGGTQARPSSRMASNRVNLVSTSTPRRCTPHFTSPPLHSPVLAHSRIHRSSRTFTGAHRAVTRHSVQKLKRQQQCRRRENRYQTSASCGNVNLTTALHPATTDDTHTFTLRVRLITQGRRTHCMAPRVTVVGRVPVALAATTTVGGLEA